MQAAIVIGGVVAMSSTAITLKRLSDDGELGSQHGRLAVGSLLFQDLATLPFLVPVGVEQGQGFRGPTLVRELVLAAAALVLIAVVARPLFRTALSWAAHARSASCFCSAHWLSLWARPLPPTAPGCRRRSARSWPGWSSEKATSGIRSRRSASASVAPRCGIDSAAAS